MSGSFEDGSKSNSTGDPFCVLSVKRIVEFKPLSQRDHPFGPLYYSWTCGSGRKNVTGADELSAKTTIRHNPNPAQIWIRNGSCPTQKADFGVRFAQTDKMDRLAGYGLNV